MRRPLKSGTAILAAMVLSLGLGSLMSAPRAEAKGRAWLGISMQTLDDDLRDAYDGRSGVLVNQVASESPAKSAGILRGDLITRIDGEDVSDSDDVTTQIESHQPGEKVSVTLVRDGRERTIVTTLAERPDEDDDTPYVAPRAPRTPRPPRAPRAMWGDLDHMMSFSSRPRLGVRLESLNDELSDYFGAPSGKGVLVIEVLDDTPAKEVGMRAGDVITKVDGKVIEDYDDLHKALRDASGKVEIEVVRKGARHLFTPTLRSARSRSYWSGDSDLLIKKSFSDSDNAELRKEIEDLKREIQELKEDRDK